MGTFGRTEIAVPRARLDGPDGQTTEWKSKTLRAYQRRTLAADALIASTYLAGTNTRRVRRALAALFGGAVGKDTVRAATSSSSSVEPIINEHSARSGNGAAGLRRIACWPRHRRRGLEPDGRAHQRGRAFEAPPHRLHALRLRDHAYTTHTKKPRGHFLDDRNKVPAAGLISPTAHFAIPGSH
jgi:Transposase, Mutator family